MKKSKTVEDLKNFLMDLMLTAKRVSDKYGHNENDIPSDWTEWVDLRRSIQQSINLLKKNNCSFGSHTI